MTNDNILDTINELPNLDLDKDPDFISDYIQGKIIEDILCELKSQNLSKVDFAKKLGKSRQYISRVLNEQVNFTIKSLAMISSALECELKISIKKNLEENYHLSNEKRDNDIKPQPKIIKFPSNCGQQFNAKNKNFENVRSTVGLNNEKKCDTAS